MKSIQKLLFTVVVTMGLSNTLVLAEEAPESTAQISPEVQIKELDQKIATIQAQIDILEKKGEENLSDKEIDKYLELQDQLLAAKDEMIAIEKTQTAFEKTQTQKAYSEVIEHLDSIEKSLLSKGATN